MKVGADIACSESGETKGEDNEKGGKKGKKRGWTEELKMEKQMVKWETSQAENRTKKLDQSRKEAGPPNPDRAQAGKESFTL